MRRFSLGLISVILLVCFTGCFFPSPATDTGGTDTGTDLSSSQGSTVASTDVSSDSTQGTTDVVFSDEILKKSIAQLSPQEQELLADYLMEKYIPCSFGLFQQAQNLSSASVWSSVEALNRSVDGDTSEESRTLAKVLEKVAVYYPDTPFDPNDVRVYDPATQTFFPSPETKSENRLLSYEVKGDTITLYYENKPNEDLTQTVTQYATTLKNSPTKGYFSFVSSIKSGSVG